MFCQIFCRNSAWLRPPLWSSSFRTEVCRFKTFCALSSDDTPIEDFESLAFDAGNKENFDECSESELAYFANEQQRMHQEAPQVKSKKIPLRQKLFYTNKVLYGPLLEGVAQRERNNEIAKNEENDTEITLKTKKRKKSKKEKPVLTMSPLISMPENAHFLGIFPGDESKRVDKFHFNKVKINHLNETNSNDGRPKSKVLLLKKSGKSSVKYENLVFNDIPKTKKIYVSSWNHEKELPSTCIDSTAHESEQINGGDSLSEASETETKCIGNTHLAYNTSDVKSESNQEREELESWGGNSSLLSVDNAVFSSVPNIIDIEMMETFPLEKTEPPSVVSKTGLDINENIITIGMFDNGYQKLPSVSKILEATMSENDRRILERWKAKMIKELGEEGFEQYRKGLFEKGKLLHGCIQSELTGISPAVENMPTVQGAWTSISHVLPKISNVSVLESRLVHPYLYYQGAVDCVATYKGMPVLIDWKTSTKPKLTLKSMFDNPLQVVAYLGALNYDNNYHLSHQVQSTMLVVAYDSGLPAHVHVIDKKQCQAYWKVWCARLVQFWRQQEVKEPA